ncbi:ABC transporter ATP-binding protein [Chakrabartyella piscis]|uniref:ABC transporter ATP-binding protein n=1 Tax=Chakrabartyella piscis TaxID=2918914 RepID=UPI002958547C|nr:ABC transporter ATP-binding protein [Chakrabartyella piscis]
MEQKKEKKDSTIKKLLSHGGKHSKFTYIGMALSGVSAIVVLFTIVYVWVTAKEALLAYPNISFEQLAPNAILALSAAIVGALIYIAALMCTHISAFRIARNLRTEGMKHLMKLPLGYFDGAGSGKLRRTLSENIGDTEGFLAHQLPDMVGAYVTPIAVIVMLFVFDWRLGLLSFVGIIACFLPYAMMMGNSRDNMELYMKALDAMNNEAVEYVRGVPVIKTFGGSIFSFKKFNDTIDEYKKRVSLICQGYRLPMILFQALLASLSFFMIYGGIFMLPKAESTLELLVDLVFYILFLPTCNTMIMKVMWMSEATGKAELSYQAVKQILDAKPLSYPEITQTPTSFDIEASGVTFQYPNGKVNAVENVSFTAKQGQTIAFVGESGGGKSTIVSLIASFFDVAEGSIKIGGIDIRNISEADMMKHISFVFQNTKLYKGSLLDNIREGNPNATTEEVERALQQARCEDIVAKMPNGLNTKVGTGGVFLSGGETQRIAIARAILKDSPIILLDEATAFTDPENEHEIQLAMASLAKDKTVILIAHRLSTVKNADCIHVIGGGHIIESGTHEDLMAQNGEYAEMFQEYTAAFDWKKLAERNQGVMA